MEPAPASAKSGSDAPDRPPYASVKAFRSFVTAVRELPRSTDVIPDSALPSGGKAREQILQAARGLGLVEGLRPTLALWQLADGNTAAIESLVRRVYPVPTQLMDEGAPVVALDGWFQARRAPATAGKARALFLELAGSAGLPAERYAKRAPPSTRRVPVDDEPTTTLRVLEPAADLTATRARYAQWLMERLERSEEAAEAAGLMDRLERTLGISP